MDQYRPAYSVLLMCSIVTLGISVATAGEQSHHCQATTEMGIRVYLDITVEDGQIQGFEYVSATDDGKICSIDALRKETRRARRSVWREQDGKTLIDVYGLRGVMAKVELHKRNQGYLLGVSSYDESLVCPPGGYFEPMAILHFGNSKCGTSPHAK
jgi:major membrane immunogen (membrane-anchored lipoprotein)